jgi:hypothetical protein
MYYNFVTTCMDGAIKPAFVYCGADCFREHAWGEKSRLSPYISAPIFVKAYHLGQKCRDPPKFGSGLPCSAVWFKFRATLYGLPINVETFRFC